jgi:hypothetical protein
MDLGGFRGRTNKLVDGCYSWWVGGCFALLEGLGVKHDWSAIDEEAVTESGKDGSSAGADAEWDDVEGELLVRIIFFIRVPVGIDAGVLSFSWGVKTSYTTRKHCRSIFSSRRRHRLGG